MSRSYVSLTSWLLLLSFVAALAYAAPARASLVTYDLTGVTLADGGSVTGSFTINTALVGAALTGPPLFINSFDITIWSPALTSVYGIPTVDPVTLSPANASAWTSAAWVPPALWSLLTFNQPADSYTQGFGVGTLRLDFGVPNVAALESGLALPAVAPYFPGTGADSLVIGQAPPWPPGPGPSPYVLVTGGTLTPVPLPPTALLLASTLIPLAWARRKKRLGK